MNIFHKNQAKIASIYKIIKTIERTHTSTPSSFEYSDNDISIVKDDTGKLYLRVYEKACTSEANGRPITTVSDICYPIEKDEKVTSKNWVKVMISHYNTEIVLKKESYCGV